MSGVKKQVLSNAIDILLNQGNLPEKLDGIPAIQWDRKRTDHGISGI